MKLIAALLTPQPLGRAEYRELQSARERGYVVALLPGGWDSPAVQATLIRLGAADAAVVLRRFSGQQMARLMDADEVLTL